MDAPDGVTLLRAGEIVAEVGGFGYAALTGPYLLPEFEPNGDEVNGFAREYEVSDVRVVANDIRCDRDLELIVDFRADQGLDISAVVPHDDAIGRVERVGAAPADYDDDSPAVRAIRELADDIESE